MEIMSKYLLKQKLKTILLFVVFYAIGVAGIGIPQTKSIFIALIPIILIISFVAILLFHKSLNSANTRFVFFTIFLLSYLVEMAGVNSDLIFGTFTYGSGMGFKAFSAPVMIGINWVMLVYCSSSIFEKFRLPVIVQIFLASVLMVVYDVVLENVAPFLDMWYWSGNIIPMQNYIAWFFLALFFHGLVKWKKVKTENPLAPSIIICQFLFLVAILLFIK